MAATYWQSSSGDVGADSSWTNGVPGDSNTPAIADGRSQRDMTTNLDQTGRSFDLKTTRKYRGNIGSPGNPYIFSPTATSERHVLRGSGDVWLKTEFGGVANIVVDAVSHRTNVFLDLTFVDVYCKGGNVKALATCNVAGVVYVVGSTGVMTIDKDASGELSPIRIHVGGGVFTNNRGINPNGSITVTGGKLLQTGALASTIYVSVHGGIMRYEPSSSTSGLSPTFAVLGGVFDISKSDQTIGFTRFVVGSDGHVIGSALEKSSFFGNVDLREDFP